MPAGNSALIISSSGFRLLIEQLLARLGLRYLVENDGGLKSSAR